MYTRNRHASRPPRAGLQAHRLEPCLNPRDRRFPRRRPGLHCTRCSEWKVGIDGRRTHLAIGFERSSLVASAPHGAAAPASRPAPFPAGSRSVRWEVGFRRRCSNEPRHKPRIPKRRSQASLARRLPKPTRRRAGRGLRSSGSSRMPACCGGGAPISAGVRSWRGWRDQLPPTDR